MKENNEKTCTPADCIVQLPEIEFVPPKDTSDSIFGRVEIDRSILRIAELDHINESLIVRNAVKNAFGRLPGME
jgi:hypothetical protein